jgi:rubredoxin
MVNSSRTDCHTPTAWRELQANGNLCRNCAVIEQEEQRRLDDNPFPDLIPAIPTFTDNTIDGDWECPRCHCQSGIQFRNKTEMIP